MAFPVWVDYDLPAWLNYLENRHREEVQLRLWRIKNVAEQLGLLPLAPKVITVTGTNGKGSTVASLEAIYLAAGYTIGTYTSPHLLHFNERIRVNNTPISDACLCAAFCFISEVPESNALTYFEMATLAALWYFSKHVLDIVVLEVGIGGRLDSTNIVDADVAIITTVDFDHQAYLGNTLEAIGYEKAGIMRQKKPCVYGDINPPASVVEAAAKLSSPFYCWDSDYHMIDTQKTSIFTCENVFSVDLKTIPSVHQQAFASAVMASICLRPYLFVDEKDWMVAAKNVRISGRKEIRLGRITSIYDVAHNPQAVHCLARFIQEYIENVGLRSNYQQTLDKRRIHAVFSGLEDKNLTKMVEYMLPYVHSWYVAPLNSKRAASRDLLHAAFAANSHTQTFESKYFDSIASAYNAAERRAEEGDIIVVYGSFLTVSAVMSIQKE